MGKIDYGGITRDACLEYIPDAALGDYVMVHVGFAISKVDEEEAARTYKYLAEMDQLQESKCPSRRPDRRGDMKYVDEYRDQPSRRN